MAIAFLAIPVFIALVWYYRRWARSVHVPGFGQQKQATLASGGPVRTLAGNQND